MSHAEVERIKAFFTSLDIHPAFRDARRQMPSAPKGTALRAPKEQKKSIHNSI